MKKQRESSSKKRPRSTHVLSINSCLETERKFKQLLKEGRLEWTFDNLKPFLFSDGNIPKPNARHFSFNDLSNLNLCLYSGVVKVVPRRSGRLTLIDASKKKAMTENKDFLDAVTTFDGEPEQDLITSLYWYLHDRYGKRRPRFYYEGALHHLGIVPDFFDPIANVAGFVGFIYPTWVLKGLKNGTRIIYQPFTKENRYLYEFEPTDQFGEFISEIEAVSV